MKSIVFVVLFLAVWSAGMFFMIRFAVREHRSMAGVVNTDPFAQEYYYVLDCARAGAMERLAMPNARDLIKYSLDTQKHSIRSTHMANYREFLLVFYPVGPRTYLEARQLRASSHGGYELRPVDRFFGEKLGAARVQREFFADIKRRAQ